MYVLLLTFSNHLCNRTLVFTAVAMNNYAEVQRLLTTGHDIEARATVADEVFLSKIWRTRCTPGKLRAPFFMVSGVEPEHRPTALHLAIFFNSMECVQLLLDSGADLSSSVWFGDVKEADGKFSENIQLSQKQPRKVFSARQLVEGAYQRNVHRLTADMVNKKVAGWKAVVTQFYKRLVLVCDAPRGGVQLTVNEMDDRIASMRIEAARADGDDDGDEPFADRAVSPSAKTLLSGGSKMDSLQIKMSPLPERLSPHEGVNLSDQESVNEGEDIDTRSTKDTSCVVAKRDKIIERKRRLFEWRDHGIVEKIVSRPVTLEVVVPTTAPLPQTAPTVVKGSSRGTIRGRQSVRAPSQESDRFASSRRSDSSSRAWATEEPPAPRSEVVPLPLLGAQSFWLESRALVIRDRELAYDAAFQPDLHKKDAVGLAVAAAASLRPVVLADEDPQPEVIPTPSTATPFVVSPPGSAESVRSPYSRDAFSPLSTVQELDVFVPGPAAVFPSITSVREMNPFSPDVTLQASSASMKRLSSSERRSRFLDQLSQRIEDRLNPDL